MTQQPPKLQAQFISTIRTLHYSRRTEEAYWHWIRAFILWSGTRHPSEMGKAEVGKFLSYLATEKHVSASTQNQALAALGHRQRLARCATFPTRPRRSGTTSPATGRAAPGACAGRSGSCTGMSRPDAARWPPGAGRGSRRW